MSRFYSTLRVRMLYGTHRVTQAVMFFTGSSIKQYSTPTHCQLGKRENWGRDPNKVALLESRDHYVGWGAGNTWSKLFGLQNSGLQNSGPFEIRTNEVSEIWKRCRLAIILNFRDAGIRCNIFKPWAGSLVYNPVTILAATCSFQPLRFIII